MASITKRPRKGGGIGYQVKWRVGGSCDGAWDSETFDYEREAKNYRARVEAAGHHRPPEEHEPASEPALPEPSPATSTFDEWAEKVLASLTVAPDPSPQRSRRKFAPTTRATAAALSASLRPRLYAGLHMISAAPRTSYALEACDAVQGSGYRLEGLRMPNLVYPAFFDPDAPGPYDHREQLDAPFATLPSGWQLRWVDGRLDRVYGADVTRDALATRSDQIKAKTR